MDGGEGGEAGPATAALAEARPAAAAFLDGADLLGLVPYGTGHINATFAVTALGGVGRFRLILQRVNTLVFRDPEALMVNVARVTSHLRSKLAEEGCPDLARHCLTLVGAADGRPFWTSPQGGFWRAYAFIEGALSFGAPGLGPGGDPPARAAAHGQAVALGEAVGRFQRLLADLPPPRLAETIPAFHNARSRCAAFEAAVAADRLGRAGATDREVAFFRERREGLDRILEALESGAVPERITHNDTKADNLLVDARTGEALCLIDLDTVMPGSTAYDFGDLARTVPVTAAEDEAEPALMSLDLPAFAALARGYAQGCLGHGGSTSPFLSPTEVGLLPWGARIITAIMGMRFLTDYLEGDRYYRIEDPGHNLRRTRAQMALLVSMEAQWHAMEDGVAAAFAGQAAAP